MEKFIYFLTILSWISLCLCVLIVITAAVQLTKIDHMEESISGALFSDEKKRQIRLAKHSIIRRKNIALIILVISAVYLFVF